MLLGFDDPSAGLRMVSKPEHPRNRVFDKPERLLVVTGFHLNLSSANTCLRGILHHVFQWRTDERHVSLQCFIRLAKLFIAAAKTIEDLGAAAGKAGVLLHVKEHLRGLLPHLLVEINAALIELG